MKIALSAVVVACALAVSGCCCGNMKPGGGSSSGGSTPGATGATPTPAARPAAAAIETATLLKDYKDNEVRADGLYKGKWFKITGKVGDIKKDITDHIYVTIGTGKQFEIPQVQCYFDDSSAAKAATLSKGNAITVTGRVDGLMMNVQVHDCEFAQ